jgi:predicted HTH transcriptional regulator
MSLTTADFDRIDARDIEQLVTAGVSEGLTIEFKKTTYDNSDAGVKEFLKDVSAFANAVGGHLIIGVDESAGVATAISPLTIDVDAELRRLNSLLNTGLESLGCVFDQ